MRQAPKTNLDSVSEGLAERLEPHGAGNVDDAVARRNANVNFVVTTTTRLEVNSRVEVNVARVLNVLLLLAVTRRLCSVVVYNERLLK